MIDLSEIHMGKIVEKCIEERNFDTIRIEKLLNYTSDQVNEIFSLKDINTGILLKLSKLLDYDFFRLYSQHLILYSPPVPLSQKSSKSELPVFRKNIYTKELIHFILELIYTGKKTKNEIIQQYLIPKTTLYKWISKYGNAMNQSSLNDNFEN